MIGTVVCTLPVWCIAQIVDVQKTIPESKWVLECVSAFEENIQKPFSIDSLDYEIPNEIDIQHKEIVFIFKEHKETVKYETVINGKYFCFSLCAGWKIIDKKLQLHWGQDIDIPQKGTIIRTIELTYKLKQ